MSELHCESVRADIEAVCTMFRTLLVDLGFDVSLMPELLFEQCSVATVTDHLDGEQRITGQWRGDDGSPSAHFIRYANGSLFAEYDVAQSHPQQPEMFVEALEVWGKPGSLKHDLRLLPSL